MATCLLGGRDRSRVQFTIVGVVILRKISHCWINLIPVR
eukprot:CCRYP_006511-RC/>CCRYP_006511-RC protein AED:0.44 eAED:1.00 QI:0/-1/0/1/-1/0/1/0/38